jgi:CheY-like chemotaxis protein
MSEQKILVIDDSATIRRLVDGYLSPLGYRVTLAGSAEDGLRFAQELQPDVILLDHQLPGTTGSAVCRQLLDLPSLRNTPVVISSTLRKRAYAEYTDLPNAVDMLPKPYTADLLATTISNALDTGKLVVRSQVEGTAVPEVIEEVAEPELSGVFHQFSVREVLDLLNNGAKRGVLQIENDRGRVFFYLGGGRIAGVSASGIDPSELKSSVPESLASLAPVLDVTVGVQGRSHLSGILELLDRKVLNPRLLGRLLRYQAALLTLRCFTEKQKNFRFESKQTLPPLAQKLSLEISVLALLIEGAMHCRESLLPSDDPPRLYARRVIRGQNLDRAGVSANHMKLFSLLQQPRSLDELTEATGASRDELRRALYGLTLADLVEVRPCRETRSVVVFEANPAAAPGLRDALEQGSGRYGGQIVRDHLALRLLLRRVQPQAFVCRLDTEAAPAALRDVQQMTAGRSPRTKLVGVADPEKKHGDAADLYQQLGAPLDAVIQGPLTNEKLFTALDDLFDADRISAAACPAVTPVGAVVCDSPQPGGVTLTC